MKDAALKLSLEALEKSINTCFDRRSYDQVRSRPNHFVNQAITATKEALAQKPPSDDVLRKAYENGREGSDQVWRDRLEPSRQVADAYKDAYFKLVERVASVSACALHPMVLVVHPEPDTFEQLARRMPAEAGIPLRAGELGALDGRVRILESQTPQFPVALRKMWSGSEVQEWINANWPKQEKNT